MVMVMDRRTAGTIRSTVKAAALPAADKQPDTRDIQESHPT
jgi:hypothetical protein